MTSSELAELLLALRTETIFFAVVGTSPGVITETLWALAHETPAVVPDRIIALTTRAGRDAIEKSLFDEGGWKSLRDALQREEVSVQRKLRFGMSADHVRLFPSPDGQHDLADIESSEDAVTAADYMLCTLRAYTETPNTRIIASIAGGRKTMGALLVSCMTILGRAQDRILHVLVNSPFDRSDLTPVFLFPGSARSHRLPADPVRIFPRQARVTLAEIPFVRLRAAALPWPTTPATFREMVAFTQAAVAANYDWPPVQLDLRSGQLQVGEVLVKTLTPGEIAILTTILDELLLMRPLTRWDAIAPGLRKLHAKRDVPTHVAWLHDFQTAPFPDLKEDIRKSVSRIRTKLKTAGVPPLVVGRLLPPLRQRGEPYSAELIRIRKLP